MDPTGRRKKKLLLLVRPVNLRAPPLSDRRSPPRLWKSASRVGEAGQRETHHGGLLLAVTQGRVFSFCSLSRDRKVPFLVFLIS